MLIGVLLARGLDGLLLGVEGRPTLQGILGQPEMDLSAPIQFPTFQGGCRSPVESLSCLDFWNMTDRAQEIPGCYFLGLWREARHCLRWQPANTLYSNPKGGNGGEIIETEEGPRNQRDQVHFIYSGSVSSPVSLTESCVIRW